MREQDRQAARARSCRGGRRHPAHRRHHDVATRSRRVTTERGLDAGSFAHGGLRRRRSAARLGDRARDRHPQGAHPVRARATSPPTACCSATCATTTCAPASASSPTRRFDGDRGALRRDGGEGRAAVARSAVQPEASSSSAPPTCATSARSTPSRSSCRASCSSRQDRDGDQAAVRCAARDALRHLARPSEPAEIVSLRATVIGAMRKPPRQTRRRRRGAPPSGGAAAARKPVYFRDDGFVDTPVYDARRC